MTTTPLPPPGVNIAAGNWTAVTDCHYYTADQMQAYAAQARADLEAENQRLLAVLSDIGQYTGEGPATTPWRDIVKACGKKARAALKEQP